MKIILYLFVFGGEKVGDRNDKCCFYLIKFVKVVNFKKNFISVKRLWCVDEWEIKFI